MRKYQAPILRGFTWALFLQVVAIILIFQIATWFVRIESKTDNIGMRVTKAERTLVMLRICYPNGKYNAGAAENCPSFKGWVDSELTKNEAAFNNR